MFSHQPIEKTTKLSTSLTIEFKLPIKKSELNY